MSFKRAVKKFFGNRAETSDEHADLTLRTRYYRTTKDRALDTLENLFKHSQTHLVNSISRQHGEMSVLKVKGKKAFIIITVIMVRPNRTAIDISYKTESLIPFDFGSSTKEIQNLYELFNKEMTLLK